MKTNTTPHFSTKHLILMTLIGLLLGILGTYVTITLLQAPSDSSNPMSNTSNSVQPSNTGIESKRESSEKEEDFHTAGTPTLEQIVSDPQQAWEMLLDDHIDDRSQVEDFLKVARQKLQHQGIGALTEIEVSLNQSWELRGVLLRTLAPSIPKEDMPQAFEALLRMAEDYGYTGLASITSAWIAVDQEAALARLDNLSSSEVTERLLHLILTDWSQRDPHSLLANVDYLPERVHVRGREVALQAIALKEPEVALTHLDAIEIESSRRNLAGTIANSWAKQDAFAALTWIQTDDSVARYKNDLLSSVLGQIARTDPDFAMQVALEQPVYSDEWGLEHVVVDAAAIENPVKALELLTKMRDTAQKIGAYMSIGRAFVNKGDAGAALALAKEIDSSRQIMYFNNIITVWARVDPVEMYESMTQFPTGLPQARAAFWLIVNNDWNPRLTNEQVFNLWDYLTDEQINDFKTQGMTQADYLN